LCCTIKKIWLNIKTLAAQILFTENALREIRRLRQLLKIPSSFGLRIEKKKGSAVFSMSFDEKQEKDQLIVEEGLSIFVPKAQLMLVIGMKIDYLEDERGFLFLEPGGS
jgi:Fe-S cluster assembly iron-binding protein IscA